MSVRENIEAQIRHFELLNEGMAGLVHAKELEIMRSLVDEVKDTPVKVGFIGPGMVVTDLMIEDLKKMSGEQQEQAKMIFNILGDTVETVTPYLVENVLQAEENGARIDWMTNEKAQQRFEDEAYLSRDLLGQFGF